MKTLSKIFAFISLLVSLEGAISPPKIQTAIYNFTNDPIDVVIPSTEKDLYTLDLCIEGIRNNCAHVRRIIVISDKKLTDKAEWFDEKRFPFNARTVAYYLLGCDGHKASEYLNNKNPRVGWYLQQLLKLYAPYESSPRT